MPLPDRQSISQALWELLGDGRIHDDDDITSSLIARFGLTEADLKEQISNTGRSKFGNEIDWVKGDLGEGKRGKKLIRRIGPKKYQILLAGLATFGATPTPSEQSARITGSVGPNNELPPWISVTDSKKRPSFKGRFAPISSN
jgi:hypothetical protein